MKYLVFDFGGTLIKYALISEQYEILERGDFSTPYESIDVLVAEINKIVIKYEKIIQGIAISMPGKIDIHNAFAYSAGALRYLDNTNMAELMRKITKLPISVENDGKCAALAESQKGSLKNVRNGIVLVFGTGVGGGLIIDGRLYRGRNFIAGEFSFIRHTCKEHSKPRSRYFGADGSVYFLIKRTNMLKYGIEISDEIQNGKDVFRLIRQNDEKALQALSEYCENIVLELFNLQYVFDPELISIGGGISECPEFIMELQKQVDMTLQNNFYELNYPRIVQTHFRNDANLVGALLNFHLNYIK
jgi:Transcriptional regulator/sugar kinase